MTRRMMAALLALTFGAAGCRNTPAAPAVAAQPAAAPTMDDRNQQAIRQGLLDVLRPVTLKNCTFQRIGSRNDGGYVMCGNLMAAATSAYSYGIGGHDQWGCQVSKTLGVPVHQYDCFEPPALSCDGGKFVPHNECIGPRTETTDARFFDTLSNQIAKNGDAGKRLVVKIDVEGAEWDSLLATPDAVLERFDQLAMELHGTNELHFIDVVQKLKRNFHLVHIHFNNWACSPAVAPFTANAYQVLFVNKRVGIVGIPETGSRTGRDFDAPDNPAGPDCQLPISTP